MATVLKDRVPTYPNRKKITHADGSVEYATVEYADQATQEGTPVNKSLLDEIGVHRLDYSKSGTVHTLSGLGGASGLISCIFTATAAFAAGDTVTVDGTSYTIKLSNGEKAEDNLFVSGAVVPCIVDTAGKTVNFKAGGRKGNEYAPLTVPLEFHDLQNLLYDVPEVATNKFYVPTVPKENEDGTIVLQSSFGSVGLVDINKKSVIASITPTDSKYSYANSAYSEAGDILFLSSPNTSSWDVDDEGSSLSIRNRATLAEISNENNIYLVLRGVSPSGKYILYYHNSDSTFRVYNHLGNLVYSKQKESEENPDCCAISDDGTLITTYYQGEYTFVRDLMANVYTNNGSTKTIVTLLEHSTSTDTYYDITSGQLFVNEDTIIVPYKKIVDGSSTNMLGKFSYSSSGTLTHVKSLDISSYSLASKNYSSSYIRITGFNGSYPFLFLDSMVGVTGVGYGTAYYVDISNMSQKSTTRYNVANNNNSTVGVVCQDGWYFYGGSNTKGIMCYRGRMSS